MSIRTAHTTIADPAVAAREIGAALGNDARLLLYFASSSYPQDTVARALQEVFPHAQTVGCSTAGEIAAGALTRGSIVAMAISPDELQDCAVALIDDINDPAALSSALASFESHFGETVRYMDMSRYVGIVLMDGMSAGEEAFMDRLGDRTDVLFVGGSAGDDLSFRETSVHVNGRVSRHGAALALLRPRNGFEVIKTQSFVANERSLVATDVDEVTRTIREFDGRPAAVAYAEAVGVDTAALPDVFMSHPLGLMIADEPYVRSPQQVVDEGVRFYCGVKEGTSLAVLTSTDIIEDTRSALRRAINDQPVAGLINFNCILRTLELEREGLADEYERVFAGIPSIGFSTYGEAFLGHLNQTATMLLLR